MKNKPYQLKIDNPCGQDWHSMQPDALGKFCAHCSKSVIDFTSLSDAELIQLIENKKGKICGRLTQGQLNRNLGNTQPSNPSRLSKLMAGLLLLGATKNALATSQPIVRTAQFVQFDTEKSAGNPLTEPTASPVDSLKNVLQGILLDAETREPLSFATIFVKNSKTGVAADLEGQFKLVVPDSLMSEELTLVVKMIGYENTEFKIHRTELIKTQEFLVVPVINQLMGDLVVIQKKKWWQRKRSKKS